MSIIFAPFLSGPTDGKITFVGQAPGMSEQVYGGAFIGPAGRALTSFCAWAGINRETCYLDNVCQFFPEHDNLDPYVTLGTKNVTTTPLFDDHLKALRKRLLKTSSNVIVPLGNIALWALTGRVGITKWRGSVLESTLLQGRKVIPTIHPSATLKGDMLSGHYIIYDLIRAKAQSLTPEISYLNRRINIKPTMADVRSFIHECHYQKTIAYDIETRGMSLSHIAFAINPSLAICIPFVSGSLDVWSPEEEVEIITLIARLLEDKNVCKIGQNLSFDCTFLYREYGIHVRPIHDTMLASAIIFPDFPKVLHFLVSI